MSNPIEVTVVLRPSEKSKEIGDSLLAGTFNAGEVSAADLAAAPQDVTAVEDFAKSHGLRIVQVDPQSRTLRLEGTPDAIKSAFGISSDATDQGSIESRDYKGPMKLPEAIQDKVIAVLGLNQDPVAQPH